MYHLRLQMQFFGVRAQVQAQVGFLTRKAVWIPRPFLGRVKKISRTRAFSAFGEREALMPILAPILHSFSTQPILLYSRLRL